MIGSSAPKSFPINLDSGHYSTQPEKLPDGTLIVSRFNTTMSNYDVPYQVVRGHRCGKDSTQPVQTLDIKKLTAQSIFLAQAMLMTKLS